MSRRVYKASLVVNGIKLNKVIVDSHYEKKHRSSVNDQVILDLMGMLDGGNFPVSECVDNFEYFVIDSISLRGKVYKVIWLLEKNRRYIGVINVYRRRK